MVGIDMWLDACLTKVLLILIKSPCLFASPFPGRDFPDGSRGNFPILSRDANLSRNPPHTQGTRVQFLRKERKALGVVSPFFSTKGRYPWNG